MGPNKNDKNKDYSLKLQTVVAREAAAFVTARTYI